VLQITTARRRPTARWYPLPPFLRKNAQKKYFAKIPLPPFLRKNAQKKKYFAEIPLPPFLRKNAQKKYFAELIN
jgi:hypothetical protein